MFQSRLRQDLVKAQMEASAQCARAETYAHQIERLQEKLKSADTLTRVHEERALVLKDTIETLKEQNRALLDTLRGPDVYNGDPLASAKRNMALAETDAELDEDKDENGYTFAERLNQYSDPNYVPVSILERIRAAAKMAAERVEQLEETGEIGQ